MGITAENEEHLNQDEHECCCHGEGHGKGEHECCHGEGHGKGEHECCHGEATEKASTNAAVMAKDMARGTAATGGVI